MSSSSPHAESVSESSDKRVISKPLRKSQSTIVSTVDIIRVIVLMAVAFVGSLYYLTAEESYMFGWPKPIWISRPGDVVRMWMKGDLQLNLVELARYDGTDPSLPVYLAFNGTIYDVTAGRQTYGPGGSYHAFAGRDATRAFVTGCFATDHTPDLRGAEEMYIPVEDEDEDSIPAEDRLTSSEKKIRREKEVREAKRKVKKEVEKWEKFYGDSKKYFPVGRVVRSSVDEAGMTDPPLELCDGAKKQRPKRSLLRKREKERKKAKGGVGGSGKDEL